MRGALDRWIGLLANVLAATGLAPSLARHRAEDAVGVVQDALVIVRAHGCTAPFARLVAETPGRLPQAAPQA